MENPIRQEKMLLSLIIAFVLSSGVAIYAGVRQIYDKEAQYSHGIANAQLSSAKTLVEAFFSDVKAHLQLIRAAPAMEKYIDSDFRSAEYEEVVRRMFENYIVNYGDILRILIIDDAAGILLVVNRNTDRTVPLFRNLKPALAGGFGGMVLILEEKGEGVQDHSILAAVPLTDRYEQVRGALGIEIDPEFWSRLLPGHIYIQAGGRTILKPADDPMGGLEWAESRLQGKAGVVKVSDTVTLHYRRLDIPGVESGIIANYHQHELLMLAWKRLIAAALLLFFLFLSLIAGIGYSAHLRIREKILAQKAMIYSLIRLTDRRDQETGRHLERTRRYSVAIARHLRKNSRYRKVITGRFMEELYDAAPLHDIGKVGIRDAILLKTGGLNDEEFDEMKDHVRVGAQIFDDIIHKFQVRHPLILMSRNICRYHHEKYNGTGYPEGLQGDEIPLEARIFALADVYDALRSERPYKPAMSHERAMAIIMKEKGAHFETAIVDAFVAGEKEIKDDCRDRDGCA